MGSLIFSCPKSWQVIEPGIETDETTLQRLKGRSLSVDCPHCHLRHELSVADGHLFEMRPRQSQVHSPGLMCDEIDVGTFIQRALAKSHRN